MGRKQPLCHLFFMGKTIHEKVAVCNANGDLKLSSCILKELILKGKYSIEQLCSSANGLYQAIRLVSFCRLNREEREAISAAHAICRGISLCKNISPAQHRHLAILLKEEVSHLWHSPDDYVWEEASGLLERLHARNLRGTK